MNEKKQTDLAITSEPSFAQILMVAIEKGGLDVESLKGLMELKKDHDKQQAEMAFNEAMVKFQGDCSPIIGTTQGYNFKYAALEEIEATIKEPLAAAGLSYSWDSRLVEDIRTTTCTITHVLGHKKTAQFESRVDNGTSSMNNLQKEGSTLQYGRRYSVCLALGLVIYGEDDDGNGAGTVQMNEEQIEDLLTGIGGHKKLKALILKAYNVTDVKYVPVALFEKCKEQISTWLEHLTIDEGK